MQIGTGKALQRADGVEVDIHFHQADQGPEAFQISEGVVGEREHLRCEINRNGE